MTATVTKLPEMGSKDRPFERRSAGTLEAVLGYLGVELRFNIRARRIEIREGELGFLEDAEWMPATDRRIADLFDNIEGNYWVATKNGTVRLRYGRELRADAINALTYHREVDPFIEWLEDLPEWDGHELLDTVLTRNFGAPDDALSRWASKAPLIGAIRRAYEPGAKLDEIPILIGPQGIGKSAYVRSLLPPEFPEWHGDAIDLSAPNKEKAEALQGRVIVELSELSGLRRAEIEGVKSFVTRLDDGQHRAAYARNPETALRCCVFVGTSNDNSPLPNDPSGNRRFVPVVLSSGIWIEDIADEVRELWWAEALARYHAGEDGRLPRELHKEAAERAEEHRDRDEAIEDRIAAWPASQNPLTMNDIAAKLQIDGMPSRAEQLRIGAALRNCGWEQRRSRDENGKRQRFWYHPVA